MATVGVTSLRDVAAVLMVKPPQAGRVMDSCGKQARMLICHAVQRVATRHDMALLSDRHIFVAVYREIAAAFTKVHGRHPLLTPSPPTCSAALLDTVQSLMMNRQAPRVIVTTSATALHRVQTCLKATLGQH